VPTSDALSERFKTAVDLWATAVALRRQAIRRAEPGLTEAEVERRLSHWLQDRPGAEHGDGPQPEQA
jgi:hypothetical protein